MVDTIPFLKDTSVFEPEAIDAMSSAYQQVCRALKVGDDASAKEIIAVRIIELARSGERVAERLRDRVLYEASLEKSA